eukprot:6100766-Pyramimonas_sp.AAC.1
MMWALLSTARPRLGSIRRPANGFRVSILLKTPRNRAGPPGPPGALDKTYVFGGGKAQFVQIITV